MTLFAASIAFSLLAPVQRTPLSSFGPYDASIPKPESILGYSPGERHTNCREQERVVLAIAERARSRVRVLEFGKSVEGRPLRLLAISSPKNIAKLEEIRKAIGELSDPKPGVDYAKLAEQTPPFVWISECIHGDETASFESGMWLLYNLAASRNPEIEKALDNAVMLLNPVYNPDGHERYVVWYNGVAVGSSSPDAFEKMAPGIMRGRVNHYRFDMNRDRVSLSQDETRAEVAEFHRWNPQVYVDQHGQLENYFFPPNPMSINANVDRGRLNTWTEIFGKATASAFDRQGWLYFVKNEFDLYYAGYLDSWAALNGAIGMTHETDHGATIRDLREDGSMSTLLGGIEKHFTSAIAVFSSAAEHRQQLLSCFLKFKLEAASGKAAGKFQRVVISVEGNDERALNRLQRLLERHAIKVRRASTNSKFEGGHDYWSDGIVALDVKPGDMFIDMAQARGPLAKALLEPGSDFEPEFAKEQQRRRDLSQKGEPDPDAGSYEFYDVTGWSVIYGFGLKAWWFESSPPLPERGDSAIERAPNDNAKWAFHEATAYVLPYRDRDDALLAFKLLEAEIRVHVAEREMKTGGQTVDPGSFIVLRDRNDGPLEVKLRKALGNDVGRLIPLATAYPDSGREGLGSGSVRPIKTPNIAVVFGDPNAPSAFGSIWYALERELQLPFTPISTAALSRDLSEYTCILFPPGRYTVTAKLREWVQNGGCAAVLGSPSWAIGESGFAKLEASRLEGKSPTSVPGSLFLGLLDSRSFLGFGYAKGEDGKVKIAVPVDGSTFYKAGEPRDSVLKMPAEAKDVRLLSGWTWGEETQKALAGTVWAHVANVGRGHAVLFMGDPTERALWPGQWKMLLNSMLFGAR